MASETTAAAAGAVGVIRRDPMAMLPFCGYNMADYWQHWIDIGATLDPDKAPKIFNVNWFRKDDEGNFMWPGFGDNLRVLEWIIKRCEGKVDAQETAIGYIPYAKTLTLKALKVKFHSNLLKRFLMLIRIFGKRKQTVLKSSSRSLATSFPRSLKRVSKLLRQTLNKLKFSITAQLLLCGDFVCSYR